MDKQTIVHILEEIGTLLELQGESPFKSRAYTTAARVIAGLDSTALQELVRSGKLRSLKGIGIALAEKIDELVSTGHLHYYETLQQQVPAGLREMLNIPGLGPKKVKAIYDQLNIATVGELEYACHENRLVDLPGFGRKSQENIVKGLERLKQQREQHLCHDAWHAAQQMLAALSTSGMTVRVAVAGDLRRWQETVDGVDLVASTADEEALRATVGRVPAVAEVLRNERSFLSLRLRTGVRVDIHLVAERTFPFALHALTGSPSYLTAMKAYARQQGYDLDATGLRHGQQQVNCQQEEEIFAALGLPVIPAELREGLGEVEAAARGALPALVEAHDIQGVFHVHSTWSDGRATIEEMVRAAQALGYRYLGLSDHSQSARYAHGLEPERVREQQRLIEAVNERCEGITVFKGSEVDILPDGSLDYPDALLDQMDFVIASIHSRFQMPAADMTARIIKAIQHPAVTMIGHLTGRLLLAREGYSLDVAAVLETATRHGVIIELNANPHRLDVDWRHLRSDYGQGLLTSINPDAHSPDGLGDVTYGLGSARKGGLTAALVFNTRSVHDVQEWLSQRRQARHRR